MISTLMLSIATEFLGQKDTLIYVGDPMCSWCYGFIPELDKVKSTYPDLEFKIVLGGLRAGGTQKMSELKSFLTSHWEEVHQRTEQPFNYIILEEKDLVYDTEPSCRAVVAVRAISPDKAYLYFKKLQSAFYFENKNPLDVNTFIQVAKECDIDPEIFISAYHSPSIKKNTAEDFEWTSKVGVRGFPSLLMKNADKIYGLSNGYVTYEEIKKKLGAFGYK